MYLPSIQNEKFMNTAIALSKRSRFYFEILTYCNFKEVIHPAFMFAIGMMKNGTFTLYYNPNYVEKLSEEQLQYGIIHEIQHFLSNHMQRTLFLALEPDLANIAQDMIINKNIDEQFKLPRPVFTSSDGKEMGKGVTLPSEYTGELISEFVYDWLKEQEKKNPQTKKITVKIKMPGGGGSGQPQNEPGQGDPNEVEIEVTMDKQGNIYIDQEKLKEQLGIEDEATGALKDAIIDELIKKCQARGLTTGQDDETIGKLRRSKKNYLAAIKSSLSNVIGSMKHTSWKTFSRKYDLAPGFNRVKYEMNVILDTSGSMSGLFEKALSYVFHRDITLNVVMCDTEVKKTIQCNHLSDVQRLKISGLGGTTLQPGISYIASNKKLRDKPLLVLTDGFHETLNFDAIKGKVLIISVGTESPTEGSKIIKKIVVQKE